MYSSIEVATLKERPDLEEPVHRLAGEAWPTFMLHAHLPHWGRLFDDFATFQILFLDTEGTLVALGHTIPFTWNGALEDLPPTLNEVTQRAVEARRKGVKPDALSALAAIVSGSYQRRGLSAEVLRTMRFLAAEHDLRSLVAPVRPTMKSLYPLMPIERYARWEREDGSPFDPWIRVHRRLGARLLKLAPEAMTVAGTVTEWEEWTGMSFPESGRYVVPGALQPVRIDRERNRGRYVDPNVWMEHPVP